STMVMATSARETPDSESSLTTLSPPIPAPSMTRCWCAFMVLPFLPEQSPAGRRGFGAGVAGAPLVGGHAAFDGINVCTASRPGGLVADATSHGMTHRHVPFS